MNPITPPPPQRRATFRLGQRQLSGLSLGVIILSSLIVLLFGYQVVHNFIITRNIITAENNLRQLYKAMGSYAMDTDGQLPDATRWRDQTVGYLSASPGTPGGKLSFLNGTTDSGTVGYAFNTLASKYNTETGETPNRKPIPANRLILLIEKRGVAKNANETVTIPPQTSEESIQELGRILQFPHRSDDGDGATAVVLFADGHIERKTRSQLR
jgi:prepilin-type processing-associated H-X9-DG protein